MQLQNGDYLTHCLQYIVVNGHSLAVLPVGSGVIQGVSEPLLFLIYISEMFSIDFHNDSTFCICADDVVLYHTPVDYDNLQQSIESIGQM